jgi:predicted nucleic acid-binding protein
VRNSWVVNASPLILLAKVGRIDLLLDLTEKLVVPAAVAGEI